MKKYSGWFALLLVLLLMCGCVTGAGSSIDLRRLNDEVESGGLRERSTWQLTDSWAPWSAPRDDLGELTIRSAER